MAQVVLDIEDNLKEEAEEVQKKIGLKFGFCCKHLSCKNSKWSKNSFQVDYTRSKKNTEEAFLVKRARRVDKDKFRLDGSDLFEKH